MHPRIIYLTGNSLDDMIAGKATEMAESFKNVMVVLDSNHTKDHVLKELEIYAPLVSPHQMLVVEDTSIHGHPAREDFPPGPHEALEEWLPQHPEFFQEKACERFLVTMHPGGWLRRVK